MYFIMYNCIGQTGGSFLINLLQKHGIACVDEFFNERKMHMGDYASRVFSAPDKLLEFRSTSLYDAFSHMLNCSPISQKYIGHKICAQQVQSTPDFYKLMYDESILKIFLYRKNLTNCYLTKFFNKRWRKHVERKYPNLKLNPHPFYPYSLLKAYGVENYIEVEFEDLFDFKTNTITTLCNIFDLNEINIKEYATDLIKQISPKPFGQILWEENCTDEDYFELKKLFSLTNISLDRNLLLRDCRRININMGFL